MKIIESDTNESGHQNYMLEKGNTTGTLIVAVGLGNGRFRFRYMLTDKPLTARDTVTAWRAIADYIPRERPMNGEES